LNEEKPLTQVGGFFLGAPPAGKEVEKRDIK